MSTDPRIVALCSELERLFELDELKDLTHELLGLDPDEIGGGSAKGSFVKALTRRCVEAGSVEALCDAVSAWRDEVEPQIAELRRHGFSPDEEIEAGENIGPYMVLRTLGRGRLGTVYLARREGEDVRLKVLKREATLDRSGLQRYLTAARIIGSLGHPGLPRHVVAGEFDGRYCVAQRFVDGQTLAARLSKTGAMHIEEARGLIRGVLEPLAALHGKRLAHGDLRPENILVGADEFGTDVIVLLDPGSHYLSVRAPVQNGASDRLASLGSSKTLSPEQIEGRLADSRSDLYSFGAVLFELLTGRAVFPARSSAEAFMAHLTRDPELPSVVAPTGWIAPDVDDFITELLNKNPDYRPKNAEDLLQRIDALGVTPASPERFISPEELEERVSDLLAAPDDELAEEALLAAIREGGDVHRIAETFCLAADFVDPATTRNAHAVEYRLLSRAARLYDVSLKNAEAAEPLYEKLVELDAGDADAAAALERIRKQLGKHEEIIEGLLQRLELVDDRQEKAKLLSEIGRIYGAELGDREQALVAYTQAFCEDPSRANHAREVERYAGKSMDAWNEVMSSAVEASNADLPTDMKNALLLQMAKWYFDPIGRSDLALSCYGAVLSNDSTHGDALDGMAVIYRKAGQWGELGNVLLARAESPSTPGPLARDLRAEAAELLAARLNNVAAARELYEKVLEEDPSHEKACATLAQIYEAAGEFASYVKILERRADALDGEEQLDAMFRIGEVYEMHLQDISEAIRRYRAVIARDPKHIDALHGLDRSLSRAGRFEELIENLEMQIAAAATPRQKIQLYERVAAVWDEEFLNHARAAEAWENVLDLDADHDAALTNLARHYRAMERWNDVVLVYERHMDLLSDDRERQIEKALGLGRVLGQELKLAERAISVYEKVLELDPQNAEALEAIAGLRVTTGETAFALQALESLAEKAPTPQAKAEQYIRAAQLLESLGDQDGAIERYKMAVDANPKDRSASIILRAAYVARGDNSAAAELLEQEIRQTEGEAARAKLSGEMAAHCLDRLGDESRAESWAKVALDIDPTNLDALRVMGDLAFSAERYIEAARYYDQVASRTEALTQPEAVRILGAYIECLVKNKKGERAVEIAEKLLGLAPDDVDVLGRVAELSFEHGQAKRSFDLHWELLHRSGQELTDHRRARILYRLGESARRAGDLGAALDPLQQASSLDPTSNDPLKSLAKLYTAQSRWEDVIEIMYRQLDNEHGEERVALLLEIGDLASKQLRDPSYAAKSYLAALSEKPTDRKILMKLMQLYSEEKDWDRLVKVILKLTDFVDETQLKSKYLLTAARIAWREMNDVVRASQLMQRALELDPDNAEVLDDGVEVHQKANNAEALKELLKRQVKHASDAGDTHRMVGALTDLANLYLNHFRRVEQAVAVLEGAQEVDPDNVERRELLARLYASDSDRYRDKAIIAHLEIIDRDPFRRDTHKTLRRLYTEAKRPDPAWCFCQALYVLGQADRDEEAFFLRMKSEDGAAPKNRVSEPDFHTIVMHKNAEPLLTALFAVIQPAIVETRSKTLKQAGYGPEHLIDPQQHQFAAAQTIPYAADVMTMECPPMLANPNDLGELSFLHTKPPAIVLGTSVVGVALPPQTVTFMAARHLAFYKAGLYVRQLVPTTTGLKAWLFAAIKMMTPAFPISADLMGPVTEAFRALERNVNPQQRDHLARVVSKLLQSGAALDLKKWMAAVDLTADRMGLILSDDLQTAVELIRVSDPSSSAVNAEDRVEEIYKYAVSEPYFELRQKLQIAVDS